jgi:SHS2 domain-containing protein
MMTFGVRAMAQNAAESGYETFEHTADVGIAVHAPDLEELFRQAAEGMIQLMLATNGVRERRSHPIRAEGEQTDELLVAWLEEVLFAFEADGFAPATVRVTRLENGVVEGELSGEPYDADRHEVRQAIKAVTYHALKIEEAGEGCRVRIVFDV